MPDKNSQVDYHALATKHGGTPSAEFPPELERVEGSIDPRFVVGPPRTGYGGKPAAANVAGNEPHTVEINDPKAFNSDPAGIKAHEMIHLWYNQLPPKLRQAPPDNPQNPYDLSHIFEWRQQGKTLTTIPQEAAAAIVQNYVEVPHARKALQPWIDDLSKTPLSVMEPTDPNSPTINRKVRPPLPPVEAYTTQK